MPVRLSPISLEEEGIRLIALEHSCRHGFHNMLRHWAKREINIVTPGLISAHCLAIQFPQKSIHCRTTLPPSRSCHTVYESYSLGLDDFESVVGRTCPPKASSIRPCVNATVLLAVICTIFALKQLGSTNTQGRNRARNKKRANCALRSTDLPLSYLHVQEGPPHARPQTLCNFSM